MEVLFAIAIALVVKGCVEAFSIAQGGGHFEDTPTLQEPPRQDDDWYRQQINKTEAEIAYLVKQEELRETHEWLARRNR